MWDGEFREGGGSEVLGRDVCGMWGGSEVLGRFLVIRGKSVSSRSKVDESGTKHFLHLHVLG